MTSWIAHYGASSKEIDEIRDETFRSFLDVCWPYVDYFTFSSCDDDFVGEELRGIIDFCSLKKELSPWFAGRTVRSDWFGYGKKAAKCVSIGTELPKRRRKRSYRVIEISCCAIPFLKQASNALDDLMTFACSVGENCFMEVSPMN